MFNPQSLRSFSDSEIISRTETLVARERKLTLSVIVHLCEIDRRQLYLKRGYSSLFDNCTAGLGYSTGAAWRRVEAARCIGQFPDIHALLESNAVNLSTLGQVARLLTAENKDALLARIRGKSQREVEAIAAEYEPKRAIPRDKVRTIVVRVPAPSTSAGSNFRNGNKPEASAQPELQPAPHQSHDTAPAEPLAGAALLERRAVVQFSASETVMRKLDHVRSIASHRLAGNATFEEIMEFLADYFTEREDPAARHERREARKHTAKRVEKAAQQRDPRQIPAQVRDRVFVRDKYQCTYVSDAGKRCESRHVLQVDHIRPVARGGASAPDNLRVLCAYHNRLESERLMGARNRAGSRCVAQSLSVAGDGDGKHAQADN